MRMARALPDAATFRLHCTGAEAVAERVNTPATVVPRSRVTSSRSSRPGDLIPARAVFRATPLIADTFGNVLGASADRFKDAIAAFQSASQLTVALFELLPRTTGARLVAPYFRAGTDERLRDISGRAS